MTSGPPRRRAVLAAALASLLGLAACEAGQPNRDPLRVRTASGGTVDLSGTEWQGCFPVSAALGGGFDALREVHGEEGAVTFIFTAYTTADCTGGAAGPTRSFGVIAVADGEAQVGWAGDAAPAGLGAPVTATRVVLYTETGWRLDVYFVDDTRTPRVLYTGDQTSRTREGEFPTRLLVEGEREP